MKQTTVNNIFDPLHNAGINAAHFGSGVFAMAETDSGCQVFVSCLNEDHAVDVRDKLQQFLQTQ